MSQGIDRSLANAIELAANRLAPYVLQTPVRVGAALSEASRVTVLLKEEQRQHTGSFKLRGAFNRLLQLTPGERATGVVAASSGNHGAAVAFAARALGIRARVFVPEGAAPAKVGKITSAGAEVVFFGTDGLDTELEARRVTELDGGIYVSPYNDHAVVAGQGTVGSELLHQAEHVDRVYVAVGGGGLIGGIAAYCAARSPSTRVIGVLPELSPVMARSVQAGRLLELPTLPTLSDGTAGGIEAGSITFAICRSFVHEWIEVSEAQIAEAMRVWARSEPGIIEGAAGAAIAGMLGDAHRSDGGRVAVVICGGNVDHDRWAQVTESTGAA